MNESDSPSSLEDLPESSTRPESRPDEPSRWWYWIAAYPVYSLLSIPLVIFGLILFVPFGAVATPMGADPRFVGPLMFTLIVFVVGIGAIYALLGLVLTLMLPVALYVDATEITESEPLWSPDPILYGLVGLLNFLAAPVVGILVAVYYLYRRHEHVGTP